MDPMLRLALRKYNRLRQQVDNMLFGDDGDAVEAQLRNFVAKRPCWANNQVTKVVELKPSIFELISTIAVPATTKKFRAGANFVLKKDGGICSYLGGNFTAWFLSGDGKTEDPISEQTLRYHKLLQPSVDSFIIAELGGEEKSETFLFEMFSLMKNQKNGEDGVLLTNGWANIFYVKDQSGVLRAVYVRWVDDGWLVDAIAEHPYGWDAGLQVLSRKPLETLAA